MLNLLYGYNLRVSALTFNGFAEEKWTLEYILSLPIVKNVSVIILREHHLSGTFRPKEVIDSGWNIRAVAGVPKRRGSQHQHRGGVAILYQNASNLKVEQHRITDGANGSSHQAVSWTIRSPWIARPIHITGVYMSPSEGEIEEFFHTLTHCPNRPTILPKMSTSILVTSMHMSLTKLKPTSQYKKDIPSHLQLGTVIKDIHPHHLPQLPSQMHAYPLHSEAASSSEC